MDDAMSNLVLIVPFAFHPLSSSTFLYIIYVQQVGTTTMKFEVFFMSMSHSHPLLRLPTPGLNYYIMAFATTIQLSIMTVGCMLFAMSAPWETDVSDDEDFDSEVEEFEEMIEARLAKARAIVNQKGKAKKAAAGKGKGDGKGKDFGKGGKDDFGKAKGKDSGKPMMKY